MNKFGFITTSILLILIFNNFLHFSKVDAAQQPCGPSCGPSGRVKGQKPPPDQCNLNVQDYQYCIRGKRYTTLTYKYSPPVSNTTKAFLTLNSFEKGGGRYGPSKCDGRCHSDDTRVVALSSGWYNGGERRLNEVLSAKNVVDEECYYRPPCGNNVVDASIAVWKALDVPESDRGEMDITWSDA